MTTRRTVTLPTDDWSLITRGWTSGHLLPTDSPAWHTLPDGDPIKTASAVAERLGVRTLVNRSGPGYARTNTRRWE